MSDTLIDTLYRQGITVFIPSTHRFTTVVLVFPLPLLHHGTLGTIKLRYFSIIYRTYLPWYYSILFFY